MELRRTILIAFALLLFAPVPDAAALSSFKARFTNVCPGEVYNLCGVPHAVDAKPDDTPSRVEEGASRSVDILCNRPYWEEQTTPTGYCGEWRSESWSSRTCTHPIASPPGEQRFEKRRTVTCYQPDSGREGDGPAVNEEDPGTHGHVIARCEPSGASGTDCTTFTGTGTCSPARPDVRRYCMTAKWEATFDFGACYLDGGQWKKRGTRECINAATGQPVDKWRCDNFLPGGDTMIQSCQVGWGAWSSWSTCDTNARQRRARTCRLTESGRIIPDQYCAGSDTEVRICSTSWSAWAGWSSCNSQARQARQRDCYANPGNVRVADSYCSGAATDRRTCSTRWGGWTAWSSCSGGQQTRQRTCYADPGGVRVSDSYCAGPGSDTQTCSRACSSAQVTWSWRGGVCRDTLSGAADGTRRTATDPWNGSRTTDMYGSARFVCDDGTWRLDSAVGGPASTYNCLLWID